MEKQVCCVCGKEFEGFGNNPWPLKEDGRCCDGCNDFVIIARIKRKLENKKSKEIS